MNCIFTPENPAIKGFSGIFLQYFIEFVLYKILYSILPFASL